MNKPRFGWIPMKKKTTKPDLNQIISEQADDVAENYRKIYEAFLKKGFTTEQSFQLLLAVLNYKISVPL
jgi:hypothetical protein